MAKLPKLILEVQFNLSLWKAIKIRIAGNVIKEFIDNIPMKIKDIGEEDD